MQRQSEGRCGENAVWSRRHCTDCSFQLLWSKQRHRKYFFLKFSAGKRKRKNLITVVLSSLKNSLLNQFLPLKHMVKRYFKEYKLSTPTPPPDPVSPSRSSHCQQFSCLPSQTVCVIYAQIRNLPPSSLPPNIVCF